MYAPGLGSVFRARTEALVLAEVSHRVTTEKLEIVWDQ